MKNDYAEMVIASDVFTSSLSPAQNDVNNEATSIIGKIMVMSQAAVVKQTAKRRGQIWLHAVVSLCCWHRCVL